MYFIDGVYLIEYIKYSKNNNLYCDSLCFKD